MKIDNNTAHIFLSQFCGLMFKYTQTFSECKIISFNEHTINITHSYNH